MIRLILGTPPRATGSFSLTTAMIIYKQAKPAQRLLLTVVTGAIVAGGVWMLVKPDAPPSSQEIRRAHV